MKIFKIFFQIIFICCLLISNFYIPKVEAKTLGELKQELEDLKEQYENNQLQQQLTEEEIAKTKVRVSEIRTRITDIQKNIYEIKNTIEQLNKDILAKEEEIKDILLFFQLANGENAYLEYAFGAKSFTDFIYRLAVSEQLTSYNDELVEEYKADIEESKKKSEELAQEEIELNNERDDLEVEIAKLGDRLAELDSDAISIEEQLEIKESELELYTSLGCSDNESIEQCAANILPPDTTMWRPIPTGYISGYSGWRISPITGEKEFHHGLDMSDSGANYENYPIYSIANGIVVYVDKSNTSTCGGNKVYIQHYINGQFYTSGYWHLRAVTVEKHQVVTKNTQIGVMGGYRGSEYWDECSTGAHLHLELSDEPFNVENGGSESIWGLRDGFLHPEYYINFPNKGVYWSDRTTKYSNSY